MYQCFSAANILAWWPAKKENHKKPPENFTEH